MKDKEKRLLNYINQKTNLDIQPTQDTFSFYDAYNNNYILEFKVRNKSYADTIIEVFKVYNLLQIANKQNKKALYVVGDPNGVYVFNLSTLENKLISYNIEVIKCPFTTEFRENKKIKKYVYLLNKNTAKKL